MRRTSKSKGALVWLTDWAKCAQNFASEPEYLTTRKLLADHLLVGRLTALYNKLTGLSNTDDAQNAIKLMLTDCVMISDWIVAQHKPDPLVTSPTRTEHSRELRVLAGDIHSVRKKLKNFANTIDKAISVAYLTDRHQSGNPAKYSQLRMPSLRLNRPVFDMELTIDHLLTALHDDIEETAENINHTIARKRQTRGPDPLAAAMIDAVGRIVRAVIGRDTKPAPISLVVDLCRLLLAAHDYEKIPDESTVRSRLKKLSKP